MIAFIPHNGLLWIWMRLGIQGEMALWCLIAAALIRSCQLAASPGPQARDCSAPSCALRSSPYVLIGYNDLGFAWFRIAAVMGVLLGTIEAANRFAEVPPAPPRLRMAQSPDATRATAIVASRRTTTTFAELTPAALEG